MHVLNEIWTEFMTYVCDLLGLEWLRYAKPDRITNARSGLMERTKQIPVNQQVVGKDAGGSRDTHRENVVRE